MNRSNGRVFSATLIRRGWLATFWLTTVAVGQPEMVFVPGSDAQVGGPTYDFRIGRFEITNDEYVAFLNDALANLDNPRGQYLFFESTTGDVYINDAPLGVIGPDHDLLATQIFSPSVGGAIAFVDGAYAIAPPGTRGDHPVVGVSWYGAVKYCNWLTLEAGFPPEQRVYAESTATDPAGWHPAVTTTADWSVRGLTDAERASLLALWGFRLPMDGGDGAGDPSLYNEWYKAAAARLDGSGVPVFDSLYGFGRDVVGHADANYRCSGDPFEDAGDCIIGSTSPVGYFDGVHFLADGTTPTHPSDNAYSLLDLTGNVWEWMQDQSFLPADRRNRGGSFRSSTGALAVHIGAERLAEAVADAVGFRIAQSVPAPLYVLPEEGFVSAGPWGGPYDPGDSVTYTLTNATAAPVPYSVVADVPWVVFTGAVTGTLSGGQSVDITATIAPACADQTPTGLQEAIVSFINLADTSIVQRAIRVTFDEPLIPTSGDLSATILHGQPPPPAFTLALENASTEPVDWTARAIDLSSDPPGQAADWVLIDGFVSEASGSVPGGGATWDLTITFDVSELSAGAFSASLELTDDCTGTVFLQPLSLTIEPLISVTPIDEVSFTGVVGGPFLPAQHEFTLTSLFADPLDWSVEVLASDPPMPPSDLLDAQPSAGSVTGAGEDVTIALSVASTADTLEPGWYLLIVRFRSGPLILLERAVGIEVTQLRLEPHFGTTFSGPSGGPFLPASDSYTLTNTGLDPMEWEASLDFTSPAAFDWAELAASSGVILNPSGTAQIHLSTSMAAQLLSPGTYRAQLCVSSIDPNVPGGVMLASTTRDVTLHVGAVAFALEMEDVPIEPAPIPGPDHRFRMAKYEVTCAQFVQFLNDAQWDGGTTQRSTFMVFDEYTGDVSLASGDVMVVTKNTNAASRIEYDPAQPVGLRYTVSVGFENHPITFVSWYGAVKYCNWLTVVQGMAGQQIYEEGPQGGDWVPIAANAADLLELRGFRLIMDDAATTPSLYNEWYKVASARHDTLGDTLFDAQYGFGRDVLQTQDANFADAGNPFDGSTTPVGFFNGTTYNAGGNQSIGNGVEFATQTNDNAYGVFDLTGNVAEWVHDRDPASAYVRGGHFQNAIDSDRLTTSQRGPFPPSTATPTIGFRVAQALPDELTELAVGTTDGLVKIAGVIGGPLAVVGGAAQQTQLSMSLTNPGDYTIDNVTLTISPSEDRLNVVGVAPSLVPQGAVVDVRLESAATLTSPGASPGPNGDFALVPLDDVQTGGPQYDYWIGRKEVTNAEYAAFLNSARNAVDTDDPNPLSDYLYFDLISGSVFLGSTQLATIGVGPPPGPDVLVYDLSLGHITYSGASYLVEPGYENHPVVGVSWFGAVKYCNWRSRTEGIPESLLAYREGPNSSLASWRPVTASIDEWTTTGLTPNARAKLVTNTLGYRLPMDDEAAQAAAYNEWYKAAAARLDDLGNPTFDSIYGFGRNTLNDVDANFLDSGDTEENETTPVAHFNGVASLFALPILCPPVSIDPVLTVKSENAYGLSDACGNVAEWMQDFGTGPGDRAVRGGSWRTGVGDPALRTDARVAIPPATAANDVGFRLVRGTGHTVSVSVLDGIASSTATQEFLLDLREPLKIQPRSNVDASGMYGDPFDAVGASYTLANRSDSDMDWAASSSVDWVDVDDIADADPAGPEAAGTMAGPGMVSITVAVNDNVRNLGPGEHVTAVAFRNETTGALETRTLALTIEQPIEAAATTNQSEPHTFSGWVGGPFVTLYDDQTEHTERVFELKSLVDFDLEYSVTENAAWMSVAPVAPNVFLDGVLAPHASLALRIQIDASAEQLNVGEFTQSIMLTFVDPSNADLSDAVSLPVTLKVRDPLTIEHGCDPCATCGTWEIQPDDDLSLLCDQTFRLSNELAEGGALLGIAMAVDVDWVDLTDTFVELLPGQAAAFVLSASINNNALALDKGEHVATVTFDDTFTGASQCRRIKLNVVKTLSVTPFSTYQPTGVVGQPAAPPFRAYTIRHVADPSAPIDWVACTDAAWLALAGGATCDAASIPPACAAGAAICGTLADGQTTQVLASVDPAVTATLAAGAYTATLRLRDTTNGVTSTRTIEATFLDPLLDMSGVLTVDAADAQPAGPQYSFKMAPFHVTNAEFVAFLNDAMADPTGEKGQYLYFDSDTGDVYVNRSATGEIGTNTQGLIAKVFSTSATGRIQYAGGVYSVVTAPSDYADHPVAGVSWYGAVKYCNWLTLDQGLAPDERCYGEGPQSDLAAWRPVTIPSAIWATRDLNDDERDALVRGFRGYRLPMDDGANNIDFTTDAADAYNEWYKAAAWDSAALVNHDFGMGVDEAQGLTGAHANFRCSGDPFENGGDCLIGSTTPVGFFDGTHLLADGSLTVDSPSHFGLYDMSGNVFAWMQGRFTENAGSTALRTIRGGSWKLLPPQLRTDFRTWAPTEATNADIGFRVVRVELATSGDFDADADVDLLDHQSFAFCLSGPDGGQPMPTGCAVFDLQTNTGAGVVDLADFAVFQNLFSGPL